MSIQPIIQDMILFLIMVGSIVLAVWLWRRFKGR